MRYTTTPSVDQGVRAERTLLNVLPRAATVEGVGPDSRVGVIVNGQPIQLKWVGEGNLRDVRPVVAIGDDAPDIVVARRFSPGARALLSETGIGWVDETGAAEIALGTIVVSRTGRATPPDSKLKRWTPAVMAVAEALLCGTDATVAATAHVTGLSTGSCTNALRFLTERELLESQAARGPASARRIPDPDRLLDAYAAAVEAATPEISVEAGIQGRDPVAELVKVGWEWNQTDVSWAATGAGAAAVLAPYLTEVTTVDVYVGADTLVGLEAVAAGAGLRVIEGGRLTLRPFPTVAVRKLAQTLEDLRVAPWPRVFADLRTIGVRGEEAAEHLREVMHAR